MIKNKLTQYLFGFVMVVCFQLQAIGQNSEPNIGTVELLSTATRIMVISGTEYKFNSSTVLANDDSGDNDDLDIQDFAPGTVVEYRVGGSGKTPTLNYLRLYLP